MSVGRSSTPWRTGYVPAVRGGCCRTTSRRGRRSTTTGGPGGGGGGGGGSLPRRGGGGGPRRGGDGRPRREGRWERILARLREGERTRLGRDATPSAGVLDSQSVKGTDRGGMHGYDGAKKVNGVKRHLLVDTLGIVVKACVSPANVGDRDAAMVLLSLLGKELTRLRHLWVDAGYRGAFVPWAKQMLGITVQITHRRDGGL